MKNKINYDLFNNQFLAKFVFNININLNKNNRLNYLIIFSEYNL
jgi:hypothetical protein